MLIKIEIKNNSVAEKILWLLKSLSNEGVSIIQKNDSHEKQEYTDEYIEQNWKEIAYQASGNPDQDDDEVLSKKYGKYLYKEGGASVTENVSNDIMSLPMNPLLTQ